MERLSIKTPADFISLMGHSLGFWPQESLVCVNLDGQRIGATVRMDLPTNGQDTQRFVNQMVTYITHDAEVTGVVVGLFTETPSRQNQPRPHEAIMEQLVAQLGERDIALRDGWLIGKNTFTNYLTLTADFPVMHPLSEVLESELNAELIYRGSAITTTEGFHIPVLARTDLGNGIRQHCDRIENTHPNEAIALARQLWKKVIDDNADPTDAIAAELIEYLRL
ncbi:MAG: DUF4192 family protein [Acidobacteria bacterium]|nr:DUF4192 family protein [Acidobacteriota bacterium]